MIQLLYLLYSIFPVSILDTNDPHGLTYVKLELRFHPVSIPLEACTNSEDPDQILQNAMSDQCLHCLLLIQPF